MLGQRLAQSRLRVWQRGQPCGQCLRLLIIVPKLGVPKPLLQSEGRIEGLDRGHSFDACDFYLGPLAATTTGGTHHMDERELTHWLDALAAAGLIGEWRAGVQYWIEGKGYSHDGAVKLVRDCGLETFVMAEYRFNTARRTMHAAESQ